MSNSQVIAATTATLQLLLQSGIVARDPAIALADVTTLPPDKVELDQQRPSLNLFLYQATTNAAWRNRDAVHARPGETPLPPLPLNLHYLITAYGPVELDRGDFGQRVLGAAASVLHDHPVLGGDELVDALAQNKALLQVERVRIVPTAMSIEDMSKLWTMFQAKYRLSMTYEVSVVLIESDRPALRPLPVLRRGETDGGPAVLVSAIPSLVKATPPNGRMAVSLGETLTIEGRHLSAGLRARVTGAALSGPAYFDVLAGADSEHMSFALPPAANAGVMTKWAPGFYTLVAVVEHEGMHELPSNAISFALAPSISVTPNSAPAGVVTLTVSCTPRLRDDQVAVLLVGNPSRAIAEEPRVAVPDVTKPTQCVFRVTGTAGELYAVRLRVDGVDSIPADPLKPTHFDPAQMVKFL